MKKLLFFALLAVVFSGCGNYDEVREQIIGKWRYDTQAIMEDTRSRNLPDVKVASVEASMTLYQYLTFDFKEDGTLILDSPSTAPISGTWMLSSDATELTISLSQEGHPGLLTEVSDKRMVVETNNNPNIHFTRIFIPVEEASPSN